MTLLKAILLGLAQGLAEFLPISSSGHLVILQHYLRVPEAGIAFDVLLHLATGLAIIVYFWRDVLRVLRSPRLIMLLVLGSIPAGLAGVFLEDFFTRLFSSVLMVGLALLVTGVILWVAEDLSTRRRRRKEFGQITLADAALIGVGQAIAITPGISRSGTTIATALGLGIEREAAARFSFLLSVPAILGAGVLQGRHLLSQGIGLSTPVVIGGFVASFLAGLFSIGILLAVLKRKGLKVFSVYVWIVGGLVVLAQVLHIGP